MTAAGAAQVDDMHAGRFCSSINCSPALPMLSAPHCKWFLRTGTCRAGSGCKYNHSLQAATLHDGPPGPMERPWSSADDDDAAGSDRQAWRFSVASYNILADKYARHYRSYLYHEVPATYLDWHHRRSAILAELAYLQPDIICLQEVDRFEDLEEELATLGYAGLYLQRDGGRRDGCATFWRRAVLRPALVRQVRYSQYDLKDNVALLVLFEPLTAATHAAAAASAAALLEAADGRQQQRQAQQPQQWQQQQQSDQQQDQQQQVGASDLLSQWLPKGWLFSNNAATSSVGHSRSSSQLLLRPVHSSHFPPHSKAAAHSSSSSSSAAGGHPHHHHPHGCLYQIPVGLDQPDTLQAPLRQGSWAAGQERQGEHASAALAHSGSVGASGSSGSGSGSSSAAAGKRGHHRRHGSGGRRRSLEPPHASLAADQGEQQQEPPVAPPDWVQCALLVANTHIIFTPDKGDVKLGQARLLLQEAAHMADWYLEQQHAQQQQQQQQHAQQQQQQQQQQPDGRQPGGSSSSSGVSGSGLAPSNMRAVATILTGDYNSTPHSPLYRYLAHGQLDLGQVSRRNVSHMTGGSSSSSGSHHHKGYRGFRRATLHRRKSAEYQQGQQQQQGQQGQQQPAGGVGSRAPAVAAGAAQGGGGSAGVDGSWGAAAGGSSTAQLGRSLPASGAPQQQGVLSGSWPPPPAAGAGLAWQQQQQQQQQQAGGSSPVAGRYHRWSDREVRRAAGMSYDELVEDSLAYVSLSSADDLGGSIDGAACPAAAVGPSGSPDTQIARAAAAFGARAAAGAGAAAAATAAASAAQATGGGGGAPRPDGVAAAAAASYFSQCSPLGSASSLPPPPLLLRHGLKLRSSYHNVLGSEPDYTSSHAAFMDTCDYIWYTASPTCRKQQRASGGLGAAGGDDGDNGGSSSGDDASSSASQSDSSWDEEEVVAAAQDGAREGGGQGPPGCGDGGATQQYELRPVAVLVPPDGMRLPKGLPSKSLGSDHISLLTDFELVLRGPRPQQQ